MNTQPLRFFAFLALAAIPLTATAEKADFAKATVESLDGEQIHPFALGDGDKAAVVVFITTECPIANSYAPELNRLHAQFADNGVKMTLVHVEHDLPLAEAKKHAQQYRLKPPVAVDRRHEAIRATGATVTPEATVVDRSGKMIYRGRIDDIYANFGDRKRKPKERELHDALSAAVAGKRPPVSRTESIGCFIPDFEDEQ